MQCKMQSQPPYAPLVSRTTQPQRLITESPFFVVVSLYPVYPIPSLATASSSRFSPQPDAVPTRRGSSRAIPAFDLKPQRQRRLSFHQRSKQCNYLVSTCHSAIRIRQPLPRCSIIIDQLQTTTLSTTVQHRDRKPIRQGTGPIRRYRTVMEIIEPGCLRGCEPARYSI
jgi:hypothetical protein